MYGPVVCNGGALKSVLTSKDDDLFGERIDGSTGNPTYSAQAAAWIYYQTVPITLSYMQIRWAKTGIRYDGSLAGSLNWIALQQCQTGVLLASTDIELNGVTGCGLATPVAYDTFSKVSGSITIDCAGDADSDGLPDSWEITHFGNTTAQTATLDADGDGLTNLDEYELGLNPVSTDTDYDGRSNADEVLENTNPLDHASYTPVRLGYWRFNTPDWRSEGGYLPRQTLNVFQQPGWSGNGAVVSNSNPAILKYNDVEAGGFANVNCRRLGFHDPFWGPPPRASTYSRDQLTEPATIRFPCLRGHLIQDGQHLLPRRYQARPIRHIFGIALRIAALKSSLPGRK